MRWVLIYAHLLSPLKWTQVTLLMWPFKSFFTDVFPGLNPLWTDINKLHLYFTALLWSRFSEVCVVSDLLLLVPHPLGQAGQLLPQLRGLLVYGGHPGLTGLTGLLGREPSVKRTSGRRGEPWQSTDQGESGEEDCKSADNIWLHPLKERYCYSSNYIY